MLDAAIYPERDESENDYAHLSTTISVFEGQASISMMAIVCDGQSLSYPRGVIARKLQALAFGTLDARTIESLITSNDQETPENRARQGLACLVYDGSKLLLAEKEDVKCFELDQSKLKQLTSGGSPRSYERVLEGKNSFMVSSDTIVEGLGEDSIVESFAGTLSARQCRGQLIRRLEKQGLAKVPFLVVKTFPIDKQAWTKVLRTES
jgi:hypothetical protein